MSPLQQIPANIRIWLYWGGYIVGIVGQGLTIVWGAVAASSPAVSMPLWLVIASAILGLLQTQLNLLAGSNTSPPEHTEPTEYGATDLVEVCVVTVLLVVFAAPLVLLAFR